MKPSIIEIAEEEFYNEENKRIMHSKDAEVDTFINDLEKHPHAFLLACLMSRRIAAESAWKIPYEIYKILGTVDIHELGKKSLEDYTEIFEKNKLHRFNKEMAKVFYEAVQRIIKRFNGDASCIWKNKPSSAKVISELLQFYGCGLKIATMTANILVREFKIEFSDYSSIEISTDVHINRVMKRMGYVSKDANNLVIVYKARELNPEFPGILDFACWEIGKKFCKSREPNCNGCKMRGECQKII